MAIVIIPYLAGMFNENRTFCKKKFHHEAHEGHEEKLDGITGYIESLFSRLGRLWPSLSSKQASAKCPALSAGSFFNAPFGKLAKKVFF